jgi:hypothetical protein
VILGPINPKRSRVPHGEGNGNAWAIGELGGQTVYLDADGQGFLATDEDWPGLTSRSRLGQILAPERVPAFPADDDEAGWDAWAERVRTAVAGEQQSLFGGTP